MREPHRRTVGLDDLRGDCRLKDRHGVGAQRGADRPQRRPRERERRPRAPRPSRGAMRRDALVRAAASCSGRSGSAARGGPAGLPIARAISSRERVAGHPVHALEHPPRVCEPEPVVEDPFESSDGDRPDLEHGRSAGSRARGFACAAREQHVDAGCVEPPQHVPQRVRGGGVDPLNVVDGKQRRTTRGEQPQRRQECDRDRRGLGGARRRLLAQQHGCERAALRGR